MKNKNLGNIHDDYARIQKRIQQKLNENAYTMLKEDDFSYPDMDLDIKTDIEAIKEGLSGYVLTIDPKTSYKFYKDNVIFYGQATVKNIQFKWSYNISDEDGCVLFIPQDTQSFPLYNEIIQFLNDVKQYYIIWKKGWIEKYNDVK
jgi:hypothetical protein